MRLLLATVLALTLVGSGIAAADGHLGPGGTFIDDNGNTHEGMIEAIFEFGVTTGCDVIGPQYCPDDFVTRAQMATFLDRAFDFPTATDDYFSDDDNSSHEASINNLAESGVTLGFPDGTFRPNDTVSREQMASFIARALGLPEVPGDMFEDVDGTHEGRINAIAEEGITLGCSTDPLLFCPKDDVPRDQMASFLGRALELTPVDVPPASEPKLQLITASLDGALFATAPAGDDRLFVVEKAGYIALFKDEVETGTKFLNIETRVSGGGEQGLLGLAFHPDYGSNGLFYVYYTDNGGDTVVSEFSVSGNPDIADTLSERVIFELDQPVSNHNGGMIAFGEDGYLYIGLGDGGGGSDPDNEGENPTTLLGSMLRIDVDSDDFPADPDRNYAIPLDNPFFGSAAGADEVWAYGLRNPWRWSFDTVDDLIIIADVGQGSWEEVNVADATEGGINYGWDVLEGTHCHEPSFGCSSIGTMLPAHEYSHAVGQSVTGGFVYRGAAMPDLDGVYFYGDASQGWVKSFRYIDGQAELHRDWPDLEIGNIWGFGQDDAGELYILGNSVLYKIVP